MLTKSRAKEAALQRSREEYKPIIALTEHSLYNFYNAGTKPMTVEWSIDQDNITMELWEHMTSTSTTIEDAITNHIHSQGNLKVEDHWIFQLQKLHLPQSIENARHSPNYPLAMPFLTHTAKDNVSKCTFLEIYLALFWLHSSSSSQNISYNIYLLLVIL